MSDWTKQIKALAADLKTACESIATSAGSILTSIDTLPHGAFDIITGEITRPANNTPYHAGDVIGPTTPTDALMAIEGAGRINGGSGQIIGGVLKTDLRTWTSPVNVVIFQLPPAAGWTADHAAFPGRAYGDGTAANLAIVGMLQFTALAKDADVAGAAALCATSMDFPRSFECAAASKRLYWRPWIPTGSTPTPASGQKFTLDLHIIRA
jgi:hypothetical protein